MNNKRTIFLSIIIIFFSNCQDKFIEKSDLEELHFSENIKSIEEICWKLDDEGRRENLLWNSITYYNRFGNEVYEVSKMGDSEDSTQMYKTYDECQNVIEQVIHSGDEIDTFKLINHYSSGCKLDYRIEIGFDDTTRWKIEYDDNENIILEQRYDIDKWPKGRYEYKYNDNGELREKLIISSDGDTGMYKYTLDSRDFVVLEEVEGLDGKEFNVKYENNEYGDPIKVFSSSMRQPINLDFTYNSHGDWIRFIEHVDGEKIREVERVIEYYD